MGEEIKSVIMMIEAKKKKKKKKGFIELKDWCVMFFRVPSNNGAETNYSLTPKPNPKHRISKLPNRRKRISTRKSKFPKAMPDYYHKISIARFKFYKLEEPVLMEVSIVSHLQIRSCSEASSSLKLRK